MARQLVIRVKANARAAAVRDAALALFVALPFIAWVWLSTGAPMVQTAMAKRVFFADQHLPWTVKVPIMLDALLHSGLLPLAALACCARRARLAWPLGLFVTILLCAWYALFPDGVKHNGARYLFVFLPVWLYLAMHHLRAARLRMPWIAALIVWSGFLLPFTFGTYRTDIRFTLEQQASLATWLDANLPADARILIHDAGYPAYATSFRFVDVVGLKTPGSMKFHRACTAATDGRDRWRAVSAIALANHVNYAIIQHDPGGFWFSLKHDLEAGGWTVQLIRAPLADRTYGEYGGYGVYALTPPAVRTLPCGEARWAVDAR